MTRISFIPDPVVCFKNNTISNKSTTKCVYTWNVLTYKAMDFNQSGDDRCVWFTLITLYRILCIITVLNVSTSISKNMFFNNVRRNIFLLQQQPMLLIKLWTHIANPKFHKEKKAVYHYYYKLNRIKIILLPLHLHSVVNKVYLYK